MSWTGRKRQAGDRYPNGQVKRKKPPKPPEQPHRRGYGSNPLAETQHGRYRLDGAISQQQWLAGEFYRRTRLRYRAAIGATDSLARRSGEPSENPERDDAKCVAEYDAVRNRLGRLVVDLDWVLGQDAMLGDLTAYRAGLDALRRIYGV